MQNEFETVTFKSEDEVAVVQSTDVTNDEGSWTLGDEPLKGIDGSRVAAYRASTSTWRCYECGKKYDCAVYL